MVAVACVSASCGELISGFVRSLIISVVGILILRICGCYGTIPAPIREGQF